MASPNVSLTSTEPNANGTVRFLRCPPLSATDYDSGILNLSLSIQNNEPTRVTFRQITLSVERSPTPPSSQRVTTVSLDAGGSPVLVNVTLDPGGSTLWVQPEDYVFGIPATHTLRIEVWAETFDEPRVFTMPIAPHRSPTAEGSYRFWAEVRDLRPGEFWQVHGTSHAQTFQQSFAYDVGVAIADPRSPTGFSKVLQGTDGTRNEDHRIWGKPIYAVGDGLVVNFTDGFPTNPRPIALNRLPTEWPDIQAQIASVGHGSGNMFTITAGNETVVYAHMQAGSLNKRLTASGARVGKGDFLGLAGNSGNSSGPHLHINAGKDNPGGNSWAGPGRPMPFHNARSAFWRQFGANARSTSWVPLGGLGVPPGDCAIWPSESPAIDLANVTLTDFAITKEGQPWVVNGSYHVRTSSNRLPGSGVFFDVNPGGDALAVAVRGPKVYLIGMDFLVWENRPEGWRQVAGSPVCARISIDATTGRVWVVAGNGRIYSFDPGAAWDQAWAEHPGGGRANDVCSCGGLPYLVGLDDRIWASDRLTAWSPLPGDGRAKRIAADDQCGHLWIVGMDDKVYMSDGRSGHWVEEPGGALAKDIVIFGSAPYLLGMDDGIWTKGPGGGWVKMNLVEPA